MNCQEVIPLTNAYADGELDLVRTLELEKHFTSCEECSRAYENVQALKTVLKAPELRFEAPPQLARQIRRATRLKAAGPDRGPWWSSLWIRAGIPFACTAVIALLLVSVLTWNSAETQIVQEVTASHVRSLMIDHKTDIASSDQHTVKPWFDGKLDFAPPVLDFADRGFPLLGGRLDYLQGRPVAALVYQRHKHFINLFIWPITGNSNAPDRAAAFHGYNLIHWNKSGMTFWLISDLNHGELEDFVKLAR